MKKAGVGVCRFGNVSVWGRTVSTGQAEAGWRAEVVQALVKQLDGAYTPITTS